jgi:hypothetical protein
MGEGGYLGGVLAGIVCFVAGARLIRLSWRSQGSSELLLGSSFLLWGLAYVCWQIPVATANQPLTQPLLFVARVFSDAAMIVFANFTRITFRPQARWAKILVFAIAIGVLAGIAGSIAVGDWEGIQPIGKPWWWVDWVAGFAAISWVGAEGLIQYLNARERVRLGLCDPLVCNRYLLWGITGIAWTAVWGLSAIGYIDFEAQHVWSSAIDRAIGTLDITGIALVLLICFPPRFYQRWVRGAAPDAEPAEG